MNQPSLTSIVIPVKEINDFLRKETVPKILAQTHQDFEIIILPDKKSKEKFPKTKIIPTWPKTGPADKRDIGAREARGEILAFLDDDSYPDKNWLKNALRLIKPADVVAVCGPALTPQSDNIRQRASGYVWSTRLGSGGAGTYRCVISHRREVDDYPSVNFLVKKSAFFKIGGFDSHFWPGEDTKLCHDLVYKLGKKIIYNPKVIVYHHRREVFYPHLKQISRYAVHRGHFSRVLPKTSFRIGYLVPTFFVLGLVIGLFLSFINPLLKAIYLAVLGIYFIALTLICLQVFFKEKNLKLAFLLIPAIFMTHIVYGALFLKGFFSSKLNR